MNPTLLKGDFIGVNKYLKSSESKFLLIPAIKGNDVIVFRFPKDPKIKYIKRLIGLPGDKIQINNGNVLIDNDEINSIKLMSINEVYNIDTTPKISIISLNKDEYWSLDNWGPVVVPKKKSTVNININNIRFYARIISIYEKNNLDLDDEDILINKKICRQYTFQKNYYFVLGDNRHSSKDSRYWGFVPEDYIIGKAGRIFFSVDNDNEKAKIRWKRIFKKIQ